MWAVEERTKRERERRRLNLPVMQLRNCFLYVILIIDTPLQHTSLVSRRMSTQRKNTSRKYELLGLAPFQSIKVLRLFSLAVSAIERRILKRKFEAVSGKLRNLNEAIFSMQCVITCAACVYTKFA
jgi:hypothetical protein